MFTSENEFAPLEGEVRIPSGCAVSAIIDRSGNRMTGDKIIRSIATMHDRSNGLGGGLRATEYIPTIKIITPFTSFSTTAPRAKRRKITSPRTSRWCIPRR